MISFSSDYIQGAHEAILDAFIRTNMEQLAGYGDDKYCHSAKQKIAQACGVSADDVHFLTGGTQTNMVVIDAMLRSYEGVVCAQTGHINGHEAGAIEFTGHKVLTLPEHLGKLDADELRAYLADHYADKNHEHTVRPAMVYISHPTEYGTLYTKDELTRIREVCIEYSMPLFLDGARLGYGLMSSGTDVTLEIIADLCDAFYIGGTKVGALFGEAVVITNPELMKHPVPLIKQHGALMAKGRLLGVQFETLFTDGLYHEIGRGVVEKAIRLRDAFVAAGYKVEVDSPTNQQFFRLPNDVVDRLKENVGFEMWGPRGEKESVVRFVTGWTTTDDEIDQLISYIR